MDALQTFSETMKSQNLISKANYAVINLKECASSASVRNMLCIAKISSVKNHTKIIFTAKWLLWMGLLTF
jgi:hypothetical protein